MAREGRKIENREHCPCTPYSMHLSQRYVRTNNPLNKLKQNTPAYTIFSMRETQSFWALARVTSAYIRPSISGRKCRLGKRGRGDRDRNTANPELLLSSSFH